MNFIATEIINPINPIKVRPIAATLAVVLYSTESGFLKILHTLPHCARKDLMLNIKLREKRYF